MSESESSLLYTTESSNYQAAAVAQNTAITNSRQLCFSVTFFILVLCGFIIVLVLSLLSIYSIAGIAIYIPLATFVGTVSYWIFGKLIRIRIPRVHLIDNNALTLMHSSLVLFILLILFSILSKHPLAPRPSWSGVQCNKISNSTCLLSAYLDIDFVQICKNPNGHIKVDPNDYHNSSFITFDHGYIANWQLPITDGGIFFNECYFRCGLKKFYANITCAPLSTAAAKSSTGPYKTFMLILPLFALVFLCVICLQ